MNLCTALKELNIKLRGDIDIALYSCAICVIENGKVKKVVKPLVSYCPLVERMWPGCNCLDVEKIKQHLEERIEEFGYFTHDRKIKLGKIEVPYGASEILMYALKRGALDCAVTVCDGAGTVITDNPPVVQGIGAHLGGILYTTPREKVIRKLENSGCIVLRKIDQVEGVKLAAKLGYSKIGVTFRGVDNLLKDFSKIEKTRNARVFTFAVCNLGVTKGDARRLQKADLVWGCASKWIREITGKRAILQLAVKIPVYCMTKKGLEVVGAYADIPNISSLISKYVISSYKTPKSRKIKVGNFYSFLTKVNRLPVRTAAEPCPLT